MVTGKLAVEIKPEINTAFTFMQTGTKSCGKFSTIACYKLTLQA